MIQHATPVNAHIAIESDTKTVRPGALWYEETLSSETLLYVGLSACSPRRPREQSEHRLSANVMLETVTDLFVQQPWLQVGGNESVGMGWCAVSTQKAPQGAL